MFTKFNIAVNAANAQSPAIAKLVANDPMVSDIEIKRLLSALDNGNELPIKDNLNTFKALVKHGIFEIKEVAS